MPITCPKCGVAVHFSLRGWTFDPFPICSDLAGTEWGKAGEYEWCPTLAAAMTDTIWPGKSHKADVEAEIAKVRSAEK
jgi:hypothetical protein